MRAGSKLKNTTTTNHMEYGKIYIKKLREVTVLQC